MKNQNEAIVIQFVKDVLNNGDVRNLCDMVAADHVLHSLQGDLYGPEGVRIAVMEYRKGFPDLTVEVEDITADGDWVARSFVFRGTHAGPFLGVPASGKCVEVHGIGIDRLHNGRLVESWISLDTMGLLQQMGCTVQ